MPPAPTTHPPSRQISAEAFALIIALPLGQVANMALYPVAPALRQDLGLTYSELGFILSSFGVSRLLLDLPAAALVDRFHPRASLLGALGCILVSTVVGLTATGAWQVGISRFIHGGASSIVQAVVLAWLIGGASSAVRGRVMALSEAAFGVVAFVSPLVVGIFAATLNWRAAFALGTVTALVGIATVLRWTRPDSAAQAMGHGPQGVPSESSGALWRVVRSGGRVLVAVYLMTFLIFFARQAVISTLLPLVGSDVILLSTFHVGLAQSLLNLLSICVVLAGGWLGDRVGRRRLVVPGVVVLLGTQAALWLISNEASYVLISAVQSLGFLMNAVPTSLLGDALPGPARARGVVLYRFIADAAILVAPIIMGYALEIGGFDTAKIVAVVPTVAILGVLALLMRGRGVGAVAR